jgi:hypothetical protein
VTGRPHGCAWDVGGLYTRHQISSHIPTHACPACVTAGTGMWRQRTAQAGGSPTLRFMVQTLRTWTECAQHSTSACL